MNSLPEEGLNFFWTLSTLYQNNVNQRESVPKHCEYDIALEFNSLKHFACYKTNSLLFS